MKIIKFYGRTKPDPKYWPFSNFYTAPFIDASGITWPTTEHYFQAMKFLPEAMMPGSKMQSVRSHIFLQPTPMKAAQEGRRRDLPLRSDWERIKDWEMMKAIRFKFTQHEDLKQLLLDTGDAKIIEHTANDSYWGDGGDGSGKNMLGRLLMVLREELRSDNK